MNPSASSNFSRSMLESSTLEEAESFADQLEQAAVRLLHTAPLAGKLCEISRQLRDDCRRLAGRGAGALAMIAVVGPVGTGKSWLARCFLTDHPDNEPVAAELRSGQNAADRSQRLTWLGPEPPPDLGAGESFLLVATERLIELGRPYVVGDTPGFTDASPAAEELSEVAVTSASIKLFVFSVSEKRDGQLPDFLHELDGALILPVAKFEPSSLTASFPDESLVDEVQKDVRRWRSRAGSATILDPCFMPMARVYGEQRAQQLMRTRLQESLRPHLGSAAQQRRTVERQIGRRTATARRQAGALLGEIDRRLRGCVARLDALCERVPEQLLSELLGDEAALRAGMRRRLCADWLDRIPLLFFPYRSLVGLFVLTAGAWDRLIFALTGSAPSLAMTLFQVARNLQNSGRAQSQLRAESMGRIERIFAGEIRRETHNFRAAVAALQPETQAPGRPIAEVGGSITADGVEILETQSREILRAAVVRYRASSLIAVLLGLAATVFFWTLLAGPVVALYAAYFHAWIQTIRGMQSTWQSFPTPEFTLLAASFALSMAPAFCLALLGVAWCCNGFRVRRALVFLRDQHREMLASQLRSGGLRVSLNDPQLEAARYLLSLALEHKS